MQNLGDSHTNIIELASCLVDVLCGFKATWHQESYFSVSWIHNESTSCWCLYFIFLVKVLPKSVTKKSSICRKYRHRSICINNTQLTTFYCYTATSSITNLSNKYLFFTKFKRGYHPIVYPIPTLMSSSL